MRTVLVGDIHGCAASFDALVRLARPDRLILLGDIFTRGPDPVGVWERIADWGPEAVLGNHDWKLLRVWGQDGDSMHHAVARRLPDACRAWLDGRPLHLAGPGWVAVHAGVHPHLGLAGTPPAVALTVRRWPDDRDPDHPFWWQLYRGGERVIYGHDALRFLQHHRRTVGLDTGAVYGGRLSALLLEEDEVLSVPGWEHGRLPS